MDPGNVKLLISIHVLREEDDEIFTPDLANRHISIHVLREEDDLANENKDGTVF